MIIRTCKECGNIEKIERSFFYDPSYTRYRKYNDECPGCGRKYNYAELKIKVNGVMIE